MKNYMCFSRSTTISIVTFFIGVSFILVNPLYAQNSSQDADHFKQILYELMVSMESTSGSEPKASLKVLKYSDEEIEAFFDLIKDKEGFLDSAQRVIGYIESGHTQVSVDTLAVPDDLCSPELNLCDEPFPPDYPPNSGLYYNKIVAELKAYNLLSSEKDRCNSSALSDYWSIWWEAYELSRLGDAACTVIACEPLGGFCAVACLIAEGYKELVLLAERPMNLCGFHDANIDSAELQSGYENSVSIINNLNEHDTNLATHDTNIDSDLSTHDTDIKEKLNNLDGRFDQVDAQLEKIIRLLKTPQGRRPGWND